MMTGSRVETNIPPRGKAHKNFEKTEKELCERQTQQ